MRDAECAREVAGGFVHPDVMYPHPTDREGVEFAQAICADCPVITECAAHAMEHKEPHGVWGGVDELTRAATIRRAARKTARDGAA